MRVSSLFLILLQMVARFHALAEFDEAKRSCRKRLADHNRRRRKPQLATGIAESSASVIPTANSNIEKTKQAQDISNDLKSPSFIILFALRSPSY